MRALITTDYGVAPEVSDIPRPEYGPGEVLVRVAASSVNGFDSMVAGGYLKGVLPHTFPAVLGKDFAGTVEAVGADVRGFAPGDEVFGARVELEIAQGTFAEYAVAQVTVGLAHRPAGLDVARAGALTLAGAAAHTGLEALALRSGETVLITGATGGVGSLAVQLARATGARVLATYRHAHGAAFLTGLGADEPVDATGDLAAAVRRHAPDGVDVAFHAGGDLDTVVQLVRLGGRLAIVAAQPAPGAYDDQGLTVIPIMSDPSAKTLDHLAAEVAEGRLDVPITQTFTLEEAPDAMRAFGAGKHGKIAVSIETTEH